MSSRSGKFHEEDVLTERVARHVSAPQTQHFSLTRVDQPKHAPVVVTAGRCTVGSAPDNELCLEHKTVSRFHCEVGVEGGRGQVKDLGSTNGTHVDGLQVRDAYLKDGSLVQVGSTVTLRFKLLDAQGALPLYEDSELGALVGTSVAMRACFWQLQRASASTHAVLLEGETGTGKTSAADAIHGASSRSLEALVSVDCAGMSEAELEPVLFGRAEAPGRLSAFEEAGPGTLVLEDAGELTPALQARLLAVLETGELRRPGADAVSAVRCRLIATTRVDLRTLVNEGRFKAELFHRLAVLRVRLPALRERAEDVPLLVATHLQRSAAPQAEAAAVRDPQSLARLQGAVWAGNVRELFNAVDRAVVMRGAAAPLSAQHAALEPAAVDARLPYAEARRQALEGFEAQYVRALLELHQGNVSEAARQSGIDRAYLHRLLKRHGRKT